MDWEDLRNLSTATSITTAAFKLADRLSGPKPTLRVKVKCTGGNSTGLTFTAEVSEVANKVPALDIHLFAELEGVDDWVFESSPFDLSAGQLNEPIRFEVPRPRLGTLVKACNDAATLFGRELTVTAVSDNGGVDSKIWREEAFDPETDRARYEAMQREWRLARGAETLSDRRADFLSRIDDASARD